MAYNAPYLVPTPALPPAPRGIFDVSTGPLPFPVEPAMGHGLQFFQNAVGAGYLLPVGCPAPTGTNAFDAIQPIVSGSPFVVVVTEQCARLGFSPDEGERRIRDRMTLSEQRLVEQRVWQGGGASLPGQFAGATVLPAASCPADAIASLEQAAATAGVWGTVLHARPNMAAHLSADKLLQPSGRGLATWYGTPVNFGTGYAGTGPTGQAVTSSTEWMFLSGRITVYRSDDVWIPPWQQMFDRQTNVQYAMGYRNYLTVVEGGSWAIQVTRSCVTAGEG